MGTGPPRLSLVGSASQAASEHETDARLASTMESTSDGDASEKAVGSASPVHDLMQTIAAGTATPPVGEADVVSPERQEKLRILEAVLFASAEPLDVLNLATYLKNGDDVAGLLLDVQAAYRSRGVNLVCIGGKWAFRTAEDLSWVLERHSKQARRLSKAALETLAIVAYHQPVTRAEIEEVRGVTISKGTLDVLMEAGFVRPRGRRRAPGKPVTYGTTAQFLEHFGLAMIGDLPGLADLKAAGLLDASLPFDFKVPSPTDVAALMPDELPLDAGGEHDEALQEELDLPEREIDEEDDDEGVGEGGDGGGKRDGKPTSGDRDD